MLKNPASQVAASLIADVAKMAGRNFENPAVYEILLAKVSEALAERDREIVRLNNVIVDLESDECADEDSDSGAERSTTHALQVLTPSPTLAKVIGPAPRNRIEVTKAVWDYIMKHKLQNAQNRKNLILDEKLKAVCENKSEISMFELTKFINAHLC